VLEALALPGIELEFGDVGGVAYRNQGHPLPETTLEIARRADGILFGAVGDFSCDHLERALRPSRPFWACARN
jgi:3-isopropylmalate dehydrogenase